MSWQTRERAGLNTEAKFLMLCHAIEVCEYIRVVVNAGGPTEQLCTTAL